MRETIFQKLLGQIKKLLRLENLESGEEQQKKQEEYSNPYIAYSRQVIEQILQQKGMDYRGFRPIVIDTDTPDQVFGEEDDVDQVLSQMEDGLNFLEISTDRPEHFTDWKEYMEKEYGLIVRIVLKQGEDRLYGNMVLDFERHQPMWLERFPRETLYLPFQKIPWQLDICENMTEKAAQDKESSQEEYLDIKVPIGYNMLIVKVKKDL